MASHILDATVAHVKHVGWESWAAEAWHAIILKLSGAVACGCMLTLLIFAWQSYTQYKWQRQHNRPKLEPDGIWPLGNFLSLNQYDNNIYEWLLALHQQYDQNDGIWRVFLGTRPVYVISKREHVRHIFDANLPRHGYDFIRGEQFDVIRHAFGNDNVATLEDDAYAEKRSYIHQAFMPTTVASYHSMFWEITLTHVRPWIEALYFNSTPKQPNYDASLIHRTDEIVSSPPPQPPPSLAVDMTVVSKNLACDVTGAIFVAQYNASSKIQHAARQLGRMIEALSKTILTPLSNRADTIYEWIATHCWPNGWHVPLIPKPLQPVIWQQRHDARIAYYRELRLFLNTVLCEKQYTAGVRPAESQHHVDSNPHSSEDNISTSSKEHSVFFDAVLRRYHDRIHYDSVRGEYQCPAEMETDVGALFFAGQDTTSALIMWLVVAIDMNKRRVYDRIVECVDRVCRIQPQDVLQPMSNRIHEKHTGSTLDDSTHPTWERIEKDGQYLIACVYETLRLYAPALGTLRNVRVAQEHTAPVYIGPYVVEHGDMIIVYNDGMHRNSEYWGEDSLAWRPERMVEYYARRRRWPSEDPAHAAFGTFIDGKHKCPGRRISVPEVVYFMIALYRFFHVKVNADVDIRPRLEIVVTPTDHVRVTLTPRLLTPDA